MAQPYFDFHFHPVFKQFLTEYEDHYPTKRAAAELVQAMDLEHDGMDAIDTHFLHIIESQCCLDQLARGGLRVGIANVVAIEHGIADSWGPLAAILKSHLTRPLDQRYMKSVQRGEVSYYRLFIKELDLYRRLAENGSQTPYIRFLSRSNPPQQFNGNELHIALSMEGGHNLSRLKVSRPGSYDMQAADGTEPGAIYADFCDPPANGAESLQRFYTALHKEGLDLFYITLTHLTHIGEQPLATHAYGMKLLKHGAFYPVGNGLMPLGKEIIDAAYGMQVDGKPFPILIDIKHMALKSRQDFYAHRETHGYQKLPIIASHMGVTGYSIAEWKDALDNYAMHNDCGIRSVEIVTNRKRAGEWGSAINNEFTFNPWSLNLMDEDIIEILKSGGMIGISLDVRILGFQAKVGLGSKEHSEYLSIENFKTTFPHLKLRDAAGHPLESAEAAESWLLPTKEERHPICLCFNFLHIVSVVLQNKTEIGDKINPWEHLCIGSDFDGLIEPVKVCRDASQMPELERALLKWMPVAEKAYIEENGGPELLPRKPAKDKPVDEEKLRAIVRGLMYENGKSFLEKWVRNAFKK